MNAKKVLELLSKNDYTELERLAKEEIMQSEFKSSSEKSIIKAFIRLSKIASKESYYPRLAGAYYKNGKFCIASPYWGIMRDNGIDGCYILEESIEESNKFNLEGLIPSYSHDNIININKGKIFELKNAFETDKAQGNKKEQIIKINNTFIRFSDIIKIIDCLHDNFTFYLPENSSGLVLLQDDFSKAVIVPKRILDKDFDNFNIKECMI